VLTSRHCEMYVHWVSAREKKRRANASIPQMSDRLACR
jgi:hypothetical protein